MADENTTRSPDKEESLEEQVARALTETADGSASTAFRMYDT